ncbi:carbon-nitrogen hydrolase family protein [Mumia zhuanghuii]|uniref:Carbon-nitrogen hydrolase family protein n=2 Tax=Mumia TaxID=1546255 RepID=A0ABW1QL00_9ACTN|nr:MULTISPECIES: carbon-nitrogen hydrolase family protein [Mumia]KAA1424964.1 carbon-nitrogen hydrolase family protein [Mumia zhuanghuii]
MQVALVQLSATTDAATNRTLVDDVLSTLGPHDGLDLVVLPEATMHGFGDPTDDLRDAAEPLDGPFATLIASHAERLGAHVVAGAFEPGADAAGEPGLPYNVLLAFAPDGTLTATYRKIHLYDSFGYAESERLAAGDIAPVVIDVAGRRVGLMTCYDLRFPELARMLVDAGADVLCVPAAWMRGPLKEDHWTTLLRARAIENTVHVVAAGQGSPYVGHSMAIDPLGVVVAAAGEEPAVVRATLSAERLARARSTNPSLANRRIGVPGADPTEGADS